MAAHFWEHPKTRLGVYVGLNAEEPIAEEKDLFGTSVEPAGRICDHAQPGQILVAHVVRVSRQPGAQCLRFAASYPF
jgi:class 3 adenylate cyclase